jgi:SPX domain protein involved in polyphosphate accumulation
MSEVRYETKFILNEMNIAEAMRWIYMHTSMRRAYADRLVHTLYFDDPDFQAVKDNLAGVSQRVKTRLRWYSEDGGISVPALEEKIRDGRLGTKNRKLLPDLRSILMDIPISDIVATVQKELLCTEFGCRVFSKQLSPTLYVSYTREYFEDHDGIRLTIDKNIAFGHIIPSSSISRLQLMSYPACLMEIKFLPEMKERVADMIRGLHLVPMRHSKYLAGMALLGQATYI